MRMLEILTRITEGQGKEGDIELLESLAKTIKAASLCGLGQTAPNPVLSTLRYFRHEYESHIRDKKCPAGACSKMIGYHITELCKGCGRTFGEVQHWPAMSPAEKRSTWRRITMEDTALRFNRYAERAAEGRADAEPAATHADTDPASAA